ncbi:hypothetical protein EDB84DRAFT_1677483 [Lactarius hengduanensis]|nr:hypothetical protein EDB84DRAFT_1677483 [Lactarius hengduanensis]
MRHSKPSLAIAPSHTLFSSLPAPHPAMPRQISHQEGRHGSRHRAQVNTDRRTQISPFRRYRPYHMVPTTLPNPWYCIAAAMFKPPVKSYPSVGSAEWQAERKANSAEGSREFAMSSKTKEWSRGSVGLELLPTSAHTTAGGGVRLSPKKRRALGIGFQIFQSWGCLIPRTPSVGVYEQTQRLYGHQLTQLAPWCREGEQNTGIGCHRIRDCFFSLYGEVSQTMSKWTGEWNTRSDYNFLKGGIRESCTKLTRQQRVRRARRKGQINE